MTMLAEPSTALVPITVLSLRGRPIIFTPERIDQIRNLRERGKNVQEIAEIIGCTVGTLRVRCSQLGISLKSLAPRNVMILKRPKINGSTELECKPFQPQASPPLAFSPPDGFSFQLSYRGQTKTFPISISSEALTMMVLTAEIRGMRLSEMFTAIIEKIAEHDLVDELLSSLPSVSE